MPAQTSSETGPCSQRVWEGFRMRSGFIPLSLERAGDHQVRMENTGLGSADAGPQTLSSRPTCGLRDGEGSALCRTWLETDLWLPSPHPLLQKGMANLNACRPQAAQRVPTGGSTTVDQQSSYMEHLSYSGSCGSPNQSQAESEQPQLLWPEKEPEPQPFPAVSQRPSVHPCCLPSPTGHRTPRQSTMLWLEDHGLS